VQRRATSHEAEPCGPGQLQPVPEPAVHHLGEDALQEASHGRGLLGDLLLHEVLVGATLDVLGHPLQPHALSWRHLAAGCVQPGDLVAQDDDVVIPQDGHRADRADQCGDVAGRVVTVGAGADDERRAV